MKPPDGHPDHGGLIQALTFASRVSAITCSPGRREPAMDPRTPGMTYPRCPYPRGPTSSASLLSTSQYQTGPPAPIAGVRTV